MSIRFLYWSIAVIFFQEKDPCLLPHVAFNLMCKMGQWYTVLLALQWGGCMWVFFGFLPQSSRCDLSLCVWLTTCLPAQCLSGSPPAKMDGCFLTHNLLLIQFGKAGRLSDLLQCKHVLILPFSCHSHQPLYGGYPMSGNASTKMLLL